MGGAFDAAERAARLAYGRLVARLAARSGDPAAAEDALADALVRALETWPEQGVPERPEAWLMTVARRRLIDRSRHHVVRESLEADLALWERARVGADPAPLDDRLPLLFVCAHPAIDERQRAPLMLQLVLGLDARRIGSAFLVAPNTMGHRLVRAKAKIRAAAIPFEVPPPSQWPERLASVLDAIYAAYTVGWDGAFGNDGKRLGLAEEAQWLGRLIVELMPGEPEALGLLALMLFCEARRKTRRSPDGAFVPLAQQNPLDWDQARLDEANSRLREAGRIAQARGAAAIGRYQLEAAIQAVHAARGETGRTDWLALTGLYAGLVRVSPTVGARVGHAVAVAEAGDLEAGLAMLDAIAEKLHAGYQPYWAAQAYLLGLIGRAGDARDAYDRAIGLTDDPAVRAFLSARRSRLDE